MREFTGYISGISCVKVRTDLYSADKQKQTSRKPVFKYEKDDKEIPGFTYSQ
jgi:hypothetical protein